MDKMMFFGMVTETSNKIENIPSVFEMILPVLCESEDDNNFETLACHIVSLKEDDNFFDFELAA